MYNSPPPTEAELPTTRQLIRSTVIAILAAFAILITIVLPAEYAIDPTGIGRVLGLAEMGEIKRQLLEEAEKDHAGIAPVQDSETSWMSWFTERFLVGTAAAQTADGGWKDEVTFTLTPGEATEIKLVMKQGETAEYSWAARNGRVNYDLHAHADGKNAKYGRGRGKRGDEGSFTAEFEGNHGWFFRNRDSQDVTVTLRLKGAYSAVER